MPELNISRTSRLIKVFSKGPPTTPAENDNQACHVLKILATDTRGNAGSAIFHKPPLRVRRSHCYEAKTSADNVQCGGRMNIIWRYGEFVPRDKL